MPLSDLGFDSWFESAYASTAGDGFRPARVTAVDRDRYVIRNEHGELTAEVTGKLRFAADSPLDLPSVGDWVLVAYYDADSLGIIHKLLPRKSLLKRKSAGRRVEYQPIASNIDVAFVVQSCDDNFNIKRLDRYLVMVHDSEIEPVVVLSKADLIDPADLQKRIDQVRASGFEGHIVDISSLTESGLDEFDRIMKPARTYCLLGSSGVGKTTLLNRLIGEDRFETAAVRDKDHRGRHRTTRRQLIMLDQGAMIIDNPGMRELGITEAEVGLSETFSEIAILGQSCRYRDCTHEHEAGCAVLEAVEHGKLTVERHRSYLKLERESAHFERSYVEKRKRDKALGKFYKSVIQQKKDRR